MGNVGKSNAKLWTFRKILDMKVLLINTPIKNIISLEMPLFVRQNEGIFPPLGLMYIASYLKKNVDSEIRILDTLAEEMDYEGIEKYVGDFRPDVVGITAHTHNLIDVILVVDIIKKIDKKIHVCLGGPHVNAFSQEAIDIAGVDSAVLGDGEQAFAELVKCLNEKNDLKRVKGLLFKQNGKCMYTGLREDIKDLDSLPFPDRNLVDHRKYYSILGRKAIMTTIVSSRGCPYRCTFCSTPKGPYRMRSPENIMDEIEICMKLGIEEIHFVDDTFNVVTDRVIKICDEIERRRLKIKWSFRGRIDKITESLLIKAKKAGCYRIHLGVETSTDEGLKKLKKGITIAQIKEVFKWTRNIGINTVAYFLIGCSHEKTRGDVLKTIDFSKDIDPDFVLYNILTPYPSTEVYEDGLRKGLFKSDYWRKFVLNPRRDFQLQFWQEWFSREELFYLLNLSYRKFYLRPKIILRMLNASLNLKVLAGRLKIGMKIMRLPLGRC